MISVKLLYRQTASPDDVAAHSGLMCYNREVPELGAKMKAGTKKTLFDPGHVTTFQHDSFTFVISGISVGDITLGLHLSSPFYNSSQKSGRYCAEMFDDPDYGEMVQYVGAGWPDTTAGERAKLIDILKGWISVYQENKLEADKVSLELNRQSRPKWDEETLLGKSPKIAQEQLRMFVPVIFPTALNFTVNLSTLSALYESAFTPVMRDVTAAMVETIRSEYPDVKIFDGLERNMTDWSPGISADYAPYVADAPHLTFGSSMVEASNAGNVMLPSPEEVAPLDLLHFRPEHMDNRLKIVASEVIISLATMGQDQRHRTLHRGTPVFTGGFYLPPIAQKLGLQKEAGKVLGEWLSLRGTIPNTLWSVLAPYGAMVQYKKLGDLCAKMHEQPKRLCHNAQEEIYNFNRMEREAVEKLFPESDLLQIYEPPCYRGQCPEGSRNCGRDRNADKASGVYFPKRLV